METPPPALQQTSIASPQPLESLLLSISGADASVDGEPIPDQLTVHTATFTPQLRALLAESGHGESLLND